MSPLAALLNIIFLLLGILYIIALILSLPFIIYGAIKHKKNFIILGIIGLLSLPIAVALYNIVGLAIAFALVWLN